jgi:lipopolysaccharide exporter
MTGTAASTVASGAAWMVGARFAERALGLASTVVLARLLAPSDFGLVAMAMVFVAAADVLGAFGLDWALVRQPGIDRRHLDTAWTIRVGFGVTSLLVLAMLAVPAADFYGEPRITAMVVVLGCSLMIGALENTGVVMFRRDMNFTKEFQLRTASKVAGAVVAVSAALALRSYWALLLGTVASRSTATLMSYAIHPHRPRPSLEARQELFKFSVWLWVANLLTFIRTRVVELILGRITGPRELGLFSVSNELSQLASTELAAPINRALFSAYAKQGANPQEVGQSYLRAAPIIWIVTLPIVVGTYLTAPQLVMLLLGPQWEAAVPLLKLLSIAGVVSLVSTGAIHVYWAIDRARLETFVEAFWVVTLVGLVLILVPMQGVVGAAQALLASYVMLVPVTMFLLRRYASVSMSKTASRCWRQVVACLAMAFVVDAIGGDWRPHGAAQALSQLITMAGTGAVVYATSLGTLWWASGRPEGPERDLLALAATRTGWTWLRPTHGRT